MEVLRISVGEGSVIPSWVTPLLRFWKRSGFGSYWTVVADGVTVGDGMEGVAVVSGVDGATVGDGADCILGDPGVDMVEQKLRR